MADAQKAESTPSIRDAVADGEGEKIARRLEVLMAFLLGTGPLAGCHFGERPANINGNFWWRKEVRSFLTEAIAALRTAQNTGRDEEIERAWKQGFCKGEASNFGCFPPTVAQVDAEWRKSKAFITLKSSPPVSTVDEEGGGQ